MAVRSCFYAKAARTKVAAEGLEGEKVMKQVEEGTMEIRSVRKTDTEHFAAMLKARRSTRTFVVCTCHLLHLLYRSLMFFSFYLFAISIYIGKCDV